jgi:hypothetical protein
MPDYMCNKRGWGGKAVGKVMGEKVGRWGTNDNEV